ISKKESLKDAVKAGHLIPQRKRGNGTLIFGFEFFLRRLLVSNPDMETRHTLVMGSTGSGKTVLILTLLFQALLQPGGTSAVIVDGKADIKLFWTIFA
ncbi:FtsK/SpoIIIE domain-containing protein, partial [Escherichia coli]|nr:FtsK/SpoIIIE domain-containing protein [Escherichia coli]